MNYKKVLLTFLGLIVFVGAASAATGLPLAANRAPSQHQSIFELNRDQALFRPSVDTYLEKVRVADLPALAPEGDLEILKQAIERQLVICAKQNGADTWNFDGRRITRKQYCTETSTLLLSLLEKSKTPAELFEKAKERFDWYRSRGAKLDGEVTFTGYYRPLLMGSRTASARFKYPLYSRPSDLVQVVVNGAKVWRKKNADGTYSLYHDRKAIDMDGALKGKGLELVYVDNLFDAFILQVQGSGVVELHGSDGKEIGKRIIVNYSAQNGHQYTSIRRVLEEKGVDPSYLNLQGMRRYFAENPDEMLPVLTRNRSYVFFQESADGPYGASGAILSAGHSVAIDPRVFPMGALTFISAQRPEVTDGEMTGWVDFTRFAVAQDTGGAIRGASRVDVYWGEGAYAEIAAGQMNQKGELFFPLVRVQ